MSEKKTPPANPNPGKKPDAAQPAASPSAPPVKTATAPDKKPDAPAKKPDVAAEKQPDPKAATPPPAANKVTPPPLQRAPEAKPASGKGLGGIALAVSLAALALAGYQFLQNAKLASQLNDQRTVVQKELARLDAADSATAAQIAAIHIPAPGMDRDSVVKTIAENLANAEKTFADTLEKRFAALPQGLSREDVQSQIKQALATFAQGSQPTIDFSEEIAKVQASESAARQALADVQRNALQAETNLNNALQAAEKRLGDLADAGASAGNLVILAQLAAHAGQYQGAAQYLQQAASLADAPAQAALNDAAAKFQALASEKPATATVDALIAQVAEWPLRAPPQGNLLTPGDDAPQTFMGKVKRAGQEILAHTVSVTPLDDEGLAWISENPALANIVRENARLDLAFARNALQMQDAAAYAQSVASLKAHAARYFDMENDAVKQAFATLDAIAAQQTALPDLAALIQALRAG